MNKLRTISFQRLRILRDIAGQLGSDDLCAALEELIHLRDARRYHADFVAGADDRIEPEDLKPRDVKWP